MAEANKGGGKNEGEGGDKNEGEGGDKNKGEGGDKNKGKGGENEWLSRFNHPVFLSVTSLQNKK